MAHLLGETAALLYFAYALGLLAGTLGGHLIIFLLEVASWRTAKPSTLLVFEVFYGFINPLAYLLVIQPGLFREVTPTWLQVIEWCVLVAYWAARLHGLSLFGRRERVFARGILGAVAGLCVGLLVRDGVVILREGTGGLEVLFEDARWPLLLLGSPLYFVGVASALRHLQASRQESRWVSSGFRVNGSRPRWAPLAAGVITLVVAVATLVHDSEDGLRSALLAQRDTVFATSAEHRIDPRLLPAIVLVTQRSTTTVFRSVLEEAVAAAWLMDRKNDFLLGEAMDPSLGPAQVKGHTVMLGHLLRAKARNAKGTEWFKDYRAIRHRARKLLETPPATALGEVALPLSASLPSSEDVVAALLHEESNLACAAFVLDLHATRWEAEHPAWSVRGRPDVLATLFQLGFERTEPNPEPASNAFGRAVAAAMDEPWVVEHFGR